ncbi:hybrid sensor histidine kinase/response regulator transcription factor [Rudanella lutea]|uniref:hybrid sensor histidine kinase/response regulator transcription factor n=1 Tax=Rudanella lutea TaxID=451374 RepID=UPI00036CFD56|nr:hybrid sensor histidine kinase/response regulator transcription factor [Rudanella lutea]
MKWFRLFIFWGVIGVITSLPGAAQPPKADRVSPDRVTPDRVTPDRVWFEHITVDQGLSHSDAMCVTQDRAGFIWIGTNQGINRYDGYELRSYLLPVNPRNGLAGNRLRAVYTDTRGRLWAGSESVGVSLYDTHRDRFVSLRQLATATVDRALLDRLDLANVEAITSDTQGRVWVGTRREGLFLLTLNDGQQLTSLTRVPVGTQADFWVTTLITDRSGTVWFGTAHEGLWWVAPSGTPRARTVALPHNRTSGSGDLPTVRALHADRRGGLWIGTDEQIFWTYNSGGLTTGRSGLTPLNGTFDEIESIHFDSFGHLWVGTNYGLLFWPGLPGPAPAGQPPIDQGRPTTFYPRDDDPHSINSGRVHQIFEDRNQILWLAASAGGLNKVDLGHKPFENLQRRFSQQPTLPNNYANAIYKDRTRNWLWIGTRNGFSRYDLTTRTYQNYESRPLPGDATGVDVASFHQTTDGTLWVGTRYSGLKILRNGRLSTLTTLPGGLSLGSTSLETIVEDRFGTIWVGSFERGLLRFDRQGQLLGHFSADNGRLPTNQITFLLYDRATDVLWASTRGTGLLKLQIGPDSLRVLRQFRHDPNNPASLRVNYTWPLLKDRLGRLWIGTIGGGLHQLTTDRQGREHIRRFDRVIAEPNIESILQDEQGDLWMGGAGLLRFNPTTGQAIRYDVADGLQSNSFKVGAAYRDADGTLYFGGIKGVTYFQPRLIRPNPYPPVVQLTNLRIFNKIVPVGDEVNGRVVLSQTLNQTQTLTIKAAENDFSIEFVGLNYANPQKHTYAYRLIGYNDAWVHPAPGQRTANFANLPAGDYTLEVRAGNGEGQWSAKPATLQITVLPPWWKTGWAYLLYTVLTVSALLLYRRITVTQQTLQNELALEQYKAEKEKEVTDNRLRFFTNVSHELRTPLTLIMGPLDELVSAGMAGGLRDKVLLMHQQTRKLLDLVNQLLEFRKVESGHVSLRAERGNILSFVTEIFLIFKLKAEEMHLDYDMEAPTEPVPLYFDRAKLEIVLTNLLSNAFKYTPENGKIRVTISMAGSPDEAALFYNNQLSNNYLQLMVQDWGIGMRPDEVAQIFDPYYQASHTNTLRMMGTGIGLSLVKQFVEAHAGEVTVQSAPGAGTTFTIRLPFGQAHLAPESIADETPADPHPSAEIPLLPERIATPTPTPSGRILLVEDNDELRQYLSDLFSPAYEVHTATDGLDGWDKALSLLPDLVVSDVMMPRSNGLELCQRLKQHPKTMHIPVVLLTARVAAAHELEGLETGADEYMVKPFNPKILFTKVSVMLQSRARLREYYDRQILLKPTTVVIPDAEKQLLEKAMEIVETHLADPEFSVPTLVREMGMSQSAFYRQIKAITGQTVVEFIRDVRMKRAAQLLTTGGLRVSEVAHQVGFEDLKHFRRTFQNLYNLSPSEYARQHRGNPDE